MAFRCYSYALHVVNLIYGSDTFRSVCICISFASSRITHLDIKWHRINLVFWWDLFVSWPRLCCHYCHTIELHGTSTLGTTPSSLAASKAIIYLALVAVSVTIFHIGTHPSNHGTFFHLIMPPYNSKPKIEIKFYCICDKANVTHYNEPFVTSAYRTYS
jgi:hypothetical protein